MESWKQVPSAPNYEASDEGRIRNATTGRILKPIWSKDGHGYFFPKRGRKLWIHRGVLEAFIGLCPEGMEGRHLDDKPANNALPNLAWGTRRDNKADQRRNGGLPVGDRIRTTKLTPAQVAEIRRLHGLQSFSETARQYGVTEPTIRNATIGKTWAHIPGAVEGGT